MTSCLSTPKASYVFDTSPAIILLEKCQLKQQLLEFTKESKLYAPHRVMEEYSVGDSDNSKPDILSFQDVFSVVKPRINKELLPYFNFDKNAGEIWVISYALMRPKFCCVIDEGFARSVCNHMDVKITGTVGIVGEMKKQGLLMPHDLECVNKTINNCRFYLSKDLKEKLNAICQV